MDFMNMNQAAHGDREHGFIMSRLRMNRKVVVGFWQEAAVQEKLGAWTRAAAAWPDWQGAKFVRFGDNMREVAVTEGDKVAAQIKFGFSVNTHGVGDLVQVVNAATDKEIDALVQDIRGDLRNVRRLAQRRQASQIRPRSGAHRTRSARISHRWRVQRLHRRRSRICMAWRNCPASRRSD